MNALINKLKTETATLKEQFLTSNEVWANNEIKRLVELSDSKSNYNTMKTAEYNERALGSNLKHAPHLHTQPFLDRVKKAAEQHYENSVLKLADRISAKGMNVEAIEIKSAYIGVNIEMTFTDGVKTLSAWTIVASGYVQKPHYRYLIK